MIYVKNELHIIISVVIDGIFYSRLSVTETTFSVNGGIRLTLHHSLSPVLTLIQHNHPPLSKSRLDVENTQPFPVFLMRQSSMIFPLPRRNDSK